MKIDRQQFLQEMKVRKFIRKGIELYFEKKEQETGAEVQPQDHHISLSRLGYQQLGHINLKPDKDIYYCFEKVF